MSIAEHRTRAFGALRFTPAETAEMSAYFYTSLASNPCPRLWTGFRFVNENEWIPVSFMGMRSDDYLLFHKRFKGWAVASELEQITEDALSVSMLGSHDKSDAHATVNKCINYCRRQGLHFVLTRQYYNMWQYPVDIDPESTSAAISTFFRFKLHYRIAEYTLTVDIGLTQNNLVRTLRQPSLMDSSPSPPAPPPVRPITIHARPVLTKTTTSSSLERIIPKYTVAQPMEASPSRTSISLQSRHSRSLSNSHSESLSTTHERGIPTRKKKDKNPKKKKKISPPPPKGSKPDNASSDSSDSDVVLTVSGSDARS